MNEENGVDSDDQALADHEGVVPVAAMAEAAAPVSDPRALATDAALEKALRDMTVGRNLKPELAARKDANRNIFTRELLALQAGVDRGTLSLDRERHAGLLGRLATAKRSRQAGEPAEAARSEKAFNWRRRAQAAVSVSAGLMVELWKLQAKAGAEPTPTEPDGTPARFRGARRRGRGRLPTRAD